MLVTHKLEDDAIVLGSAPRPLELKEVQWYFADDLKKTPVSHHTEYEPR